METFIAIWGICSIIAFTETLRYIWADQAPMALKIVFAAGASLLGPIHLGLTLADTHRSRS
ncbi:hypothetical protein A2837_01675 [Candidatus Kaiserbacteria bacterium RIFCSPHIGHO2_01_FULL_46_22]|uniref:Uncharacterized protein n=1 Tax=Candidatus Kaiserbacteria bacterium RIFCSPHIGHO2_01_FULL_46_22 TaxID=1798475 RepID=A0A1F6BYB1_9BACT|nr:MAG: hypothetical protein A2837_01675 [Candidatus Kaiserbacteria bacterium RIFCSPHIGHO2_01_FULL_46_22]